MNNFFPLLPAVMLVTLAVLCSDVKRLDWLVRHRSWGVSNCALVNVSIIDNPNVNAFQTRIKSLHRTEKSVMSVN